ncbi:MAG: glycosyl hydrolase [Candidatus Omnitrophota bacterium]
MFSNYYSKILRRFVFLSCVCSVGICVLMGQASPASSAQASVASLPIFVIGQDIQSIEDFMGSLKRIPEDEGVSCPDGFMVYTAINDLRGLSEAVDHGAGINHADMLSQQYPQMSIIQIGLYMKYMLGEVARGGLDENIERLGRWIIRSGKDVYLRIGYEFDNPDNQYHPDDYIQAYRHIVDYLRSMNVDNVQFVWHSIAWCDAQWPAYDPGQWYPGDDYVDWVGLSFFDAQRDKERRLLTEFAESKGKPLMVAESSPFRQYSLEEKQQWVRKLFEYIDESGVSFLSYINVDWDNLELFAGEKWGDARLEREEILMKEFLARVSSWRR